jgi:hypothetical protein
MYCYVHFVCSTVQVDLCTSQRVFAYGNTEYDTLFPSFYILLLICTNMYKHHCIGRIRYTLWSAIVDKNHICKINCVDVSIPDIDVLITVVHGPCSNHRPLRFQFWKYCLDLFLRSARGLLNCAETSNHGLTYVGPSIRLE